MPYYFNSEKGLYEGNRIRLIRNWSVWVPNSEGGLDVINIGQYTKVSAKFEKDLKWDKSGSSEDDSKVRKILSFGWATGPYYGLLAEDSDLVLMSDGTWKKASELKAGDKVKALKVPYSGSVDLSKHEVDYNVTFDEVSADSQFVDNEVKVVSHADGWYGKVTVKFTDGTDWFDTSDSSYPVLDSKDGSVQFKVLEKLISGDQVLLVDANSVLGEKPKFSLKTVDSVSESRVLQTGILFTVDGSHLVLTKTAADKEAYVALEHNASNEQEVSVERVTCGDPNLSSSTIVAYLDGGTCNNYNTGEASAIKCTGSGTDQGTSYCGFFANHECDVEAGVSVHLWTQSCIATEVISPIECSPLCVNKHCVCRPPDSCISIGSSNSCTSSTECTCATSK